MKEPRLRCNVCKTIISAINQEISEGTLPKLIEHLVYMRQRGDELLQILLVHRSHDVDISVRNTLNEKDKE